MPPGLVVVIVFTVLRFQCSEEGLEQCALKALIRRSSRGACAEGEEGVEEDS